MMRLFLEKTVRMEVKPFKAFRFNANVVGDVGECIAPPYDVISDSERDALYRKSRYNIVHITKGKGAPGDDERDNVYTRAAEYLHAWITEGALKEDDQDAIYGYVQDFELNGAPFQRLSFIALARLEDFGKVVRPHEQTFAKPMLDRLSLERATAARFGLVFLLYEDPQGIADRIITEAVTQESPAAAPAARPYTAGRATPHQPPRQEALATIAAEPLIDFVDEQAVRHRLYAITAPDEIEAIETMMREKSCVIADGHHRYTVGLTYMRESGNPKARYQMIAFSNTRQKGLVVLATHRLVGGIGGFRRLNFIADLEDSGFGLMQFKFSKDFKEQSKQDMLRYMKRTHDEDDTVFGIYVGDKSFYIAWPKDKSRMAAAAPDKSEAWRALDVSVLQKLVLEDLLGLDEEKMGNPAYVEYVKDVPNAMDEMIARVDAGDKQIAFFTNPVKMQQLAEVTEAGERMPHKSTYFYPKMYTGLTIQKL
jgi:uncharacterized protein (DUF1015 family)